MGRKLGIIPYLSIWTKPRDTMRQLIDYNVQHRLVLFCFLMGFVQIVGNLYYFKGVPQQLSYVYLLVPLILAIPVGYLFITIESCVIFFTGKLIRGKGKFKEIRTAVCWGRLPFIVSCVLMWVRHVIYPVNTVQRNIPDIGYIVLALAYFVCVIWGLVVYVKSLGEVQRFSAWKALLNSVLGAIVVILLGSIIWIPLAWENGWQLTWPSH